MLIYNDALIDGDTRQYNYSLDTEIFGNINVSPRNYRTRPY